MKAFLERNQYIDYDSKLIIEKAIKLFRRGYSDTEKAQTAYCFVRDDILHSFDCNADRITAIASDVLKYKTGICHAKANLLAALLRSQGIPTGFCYQHLTLADDDSKGYCLHCFNAIYLDGKWLKVDARGNTNGRNAQFSMSEPVLAFANRIEYDEYFFDGIYAEPDVPTMELLENAKTLQDVIDGLPEKPFSKPNIY
jgi:transglutaminase-like putative cysteine protease